MKKLEERLSNINEETEKEVKHALSFQHINPRGEWESMPYFKDDLVSAIIADLNTGENFGNNLYYTINRKPLNRVYYGIRSTGSIPTEFLDCLTDWEKVYFFAGRWSIRNHNLDEPIEVLTVRHLKKGLDLLYKQHFIRKAEGEYKRELDLPEDKQIRETYKRIIEKYEKKAKQGTLF